MKKIVQLSLLLTLSTAGTQILVACSIPPAVKPVQEYVSLRFDFSFGTPLPDYLNKVTEAKLTLTQRGSQSPVEDRFELKLSDQTASFSRTLDKVPVGQLELKLELFDSEGKTVVPAVSTSWMLSQDESEAVLVQLGDPPQILPPSSVTGTNAAKLRNQRQQALTEVQKLSAQEQQILKQLTAVASSHAPEDKVLKEQYQGELQVIQKQIQDKEAEIQSLDLQIARLDAQSLNLATGSDQAELKALLASIDSLNRELDQLLTQRKQLNAEVNTLVSSGSSERLSEIQGELSSLNDQIDTKITDLADLATQLNALENKITSQNQSLPTDERLQQIETELSTLEAQIKQLNIDIPNLKQRIEVLIPKTDQQSIDRRESLQAELKSKEGALSDAQSRQSQLQAEKEKLQAMPSPSPEPSASAEPSAEPSSAPSAEPSATL